MDINPTVDDVVDFASCQLQITDPDIQGTSMGIDDGRLLFFGDSTGNPGNSGGRTVVLPSASLPNRLPYLLTPGSTIQVSSISDTTGTIVIRFNIRMYVGPRFVQPPMA